MQGAFTGMILIISVLLMFGVGVQGVVLGGACDTSGSNNCDSGLFCNGVTNVCDTCTAPGTTGYTATTTCTLTTNTECVAGYGRNADGIACDVCSAGTTYTATTGTAPCSACTVNAGKTVNVACTTTSDTTFNNVCTAGYGSSDSGTTCVVCSAGTTYTATTGTAPCSACTVDASKTVLTACSTTSDTTFNTDTSSKGAASTNSTTIIGISATVGILIVLCVFYYYKTEQMKTLARNAAALQSSVSKMEMGKAPSAPEVVNPVQRK